MVTVDLPCKVGDIAWGIVREFRRQYIKRGRVTEIYFADESMTPAIKVWKCCTGFWGKDVFATEQEALDELKRRKHEQEKLNP